MRTLRKQFIILTVCFAVLGLVLELGLFVTLMTNAFQCQQALINWIAPAVETWSVSAQNILNVTMVTLVAGVLMNGFVAALFLQLQKLSYIHLMQAKQTIIFLLFSQCLLGLMPLVTVLIVLTLFYPKNKQEMFQMSRLVMQKQMMQHFENMGKNPQLFAMSLQIGFLKSELKLNKISQDDYFLRLNEILTRGVSQENGLYHSNK